MVKFSISFACGQEESVRHILYFIVVRNDEIVLQCEFCKDQPDSGRDLSPISFWQTKIETSVNIFFAFQNDIIQIKVMFTPRSVL